MTAVPKDTLLGLIKWILTGCCSSDMDLKNPTGPTRSSLATAGPDVNTDPAQGSAADKKLRECLSKERAAGLGAHGPCFIRR